MQDNNMIKDVNDFHVKFRLPQNHEPGFLDPTMHKFRVDFMQEELDEFILAASEKNLANALDALIDLVYVAIGTAWLMNLPFAKGWAAVHIANMFKVRASDASQSKRYTSFDVVKPAGWQPPNMEKVIKDYQLELFKSSED